jgi:hypothetical protein
MRRTKRVEITVETSRLVIRRGVGEAPVWCARCSAPARTVTPGEAAALAGVSTGTVYRRVRAGRLHVIETAGSPLICLDSLLVSTDGGGDDDAAEHAADDRSHG